VTTTTHLAAVLLLALAAAEKIPSYTNDDLARMAPVRAETGGDSRPPQLPTAPAVSRPEPPARGEEYWRAEADRTREQVRKVQARLDALHDRIDQRPRTSTHGRAGLALVLVDDAQARSLAAQEARLHAEIRELEDRLLDRARAAGALPGWLR
jgi:hypothetical protein